MESKKGYYDDRPVDYFVSGQICKVQWLPEWEPREIIWYRQRFTDRPYKQPAWRPGKD